MKASHSALETYARCSEQYRLKYLVKIPEILRLKKIPEVALVTGGLVHQALEAHYKHGVKPWLWLQDWWITELRKYGAEDLINELISIAKDITTLEQRCSKDYDGSDAIRTANGAVPDKPKMTKGYQEAFKSLGLEFRQASIDQAIAALAPDSDWACIPLSAVYADSSGMLHAWTSPKIIDKTVSVERAFYFEFPSETDQKTYMRGKIDLLCRTVDDKLMLVDHKTSRGDPPPDWKVAMNDQLLLYGWIHLHMTGELIDRIAVNHIRSGRLVAAPFDMSRAEEVVERHGHAVRGIQNQIFIKQNPVNYIQNCYRDHGGIACPFLSYCHPEFVIQAGLLN